jgi:IS5 family transposase
MVLVELMKAMKQLRSGPRTGFSAEGREADPKAVFLAEMETVVPWSRLEALIEPFYPKKGQWPPADGRSPRVADSLPAAMVRLLRSGVGKKRARCAAVAPVRGLDAFEDVMPDESTILRFPSLLEKHDLAGGDLCRESTRCCPRKACR